jgi:hypothetical protein
MNQMTVRIMKATAAPGALWQNTPRVAGNNYRFYTFYSFDNDERIVLGEDRECGSDVVAIAYGREMLAFGGYRKIEIWLRNARVAVVQKNGVNDEPSPVSVETQEPIPVRRDASDRGAFSGNSQLTGHAANDA